MNRCDTQCQNLKDNNSTDKLQTSLGLKANDAPTFKKNTIQSEDPDDEPLSINSDPG